MRILVLLASLMAGILRADTVTYTTSVINGEFQYDFTLTNTADTGGTLFDLFLHIPTDIATIDTAAIGTPAGWGDSNGGLLFFGPDTSPSTAFIEWSADFSGVDDVQIGNSLAGFSFTATQPLDTPIEFALNGSTVFSEAHNASVNAAVPEPGSFGLLMASFAAIGYGIKRRRDPHTRP